MPYALLPERSVLRLQGEEVRPFLQGLITNDIDRLSPERALYAALLTPQGKYLFDFFLVQEGEAVLLDCEAARVEDLKKRLTLYRLRAKVAIDDISADYVVAALFDEKSERALMGMPAEPGAVRREGDVCLYVDPRLAEAGTRAILPAKRAEGFFEARDFAQAGAGDYDDHRLALGLPDGSRDLVVDKAIMVESNFEELNGVDFKKGCYVGQELTARTKYRGLVRRRLVGVEVDGPLPEPGTPVLLNGKDAGTVRSGHGRRAMAVLRLEALAQVDGESGLIAGETRLRPVLPPWIRLDLSEVS